MKDINTFLLLSLVLLAACTETKKILVVSHSNLPTPAGPYSHSTSFQDLVFVSGQIGIDPNTNTLKQGLEEQITQIFQNANHILENNHSDLNHVVKTTVFIKDMRQFATINKLYATYFPVYFPARSTIEIATLPMNADIEIEFIAVKVR
jgi:2-iminobutanoate/2-iminopropanoate deaminase